MDGIKQLALERRVSVIRLETRRIAEYLETLSLQLDTLQRRIVAPRLEKLMALERRASDLRTRLDKLDSRLALEQWHHDGEAFARLMARGDYLETWKFIESNFFGLK